MLLLLLLLLLLCGMGRGCTRGRACCNVDQHLPAMLHPGADVGVALKLELKRHALQRSRLRNCNGSSAAASLALQPRVWLVLCERFVPGLCAAA